jgi:hypothetical protein
MEPYRSVSIIVIFPHWPSGVANAGPMMSKEEELRKLEDLIGRTRQEAEMLAEEARILNENANERAEAANERARQASERLKALLRKHDKSK